MCSTSIRASKYSLSIHSKKHFFLIDFSRDKFRITVLQSGKPNLKGSSLPHNRSTGYQNLQAEFLLVALGFISGQPDLKSGRSFSVFKSLPYNRLAGNEIRQAGFKVFNTIPLPLSFRHSGSLSLSLKADYSSLDFIPKSINLILFHFKSFMLVFEHTNIYYFAFWIIWMFAMILNYMFLLTLRT